MSAIKRGTPSGDAYLDLQSRARREGRPTQELFQLYVLEGFLARLAISDARDQFVLKGGVLLAAFDARRPTKDIDLAALGIANDADTVLALIRRVLALTPVIDDGIEFLPDTATADVIREDDDYAGVRVRAQARIAAAKLVFHVDVNVGDPVWPAPTTVSLPRLRGGSPLELAGYPIHMVFAEKIVTAINRGIINTRWRDFGDMWTLSRQHAINADDLAHAITEVAGYRHVSMRPMTVTLAGYAERAQERWAQWRLNHDFSTLPESFADVLAAVTMFADPILTDATHGTTWNPLVGSWE